MIPLNIFPNILPTIGKFVFVYSTKPLIALDPCTELAQSLKLCAISAKPFAAQPYKGLNLLNIAAEPFTKLCVALSKCWNILGPCVFKISNERLATDEFFAQLSILPLAVSI